jgi:hypothetical protein
MSPARNRWRSPAISAPSVIPSPSVSSGGTTKLVVQEKANCWLSVTRMYRSPPGSTK